MIFTDLFASWSLSSVIYFTALSLLLTILCRATYLLTLHPLAKYPGPFLAKFTNLYSTYYAWRGDLHVDMWRCHEKYGSKVRYGPNRLLFNSRNALHDIYGASNSEVCKKGLAYSPMIPEPGAWTTMTAVDEEMVRRKRKLVSKMVCDDSLRYFEPKTIEYMNTFCKVLEEGATELSWSDPKDLTTECRKLMTAIISGFAFGQKIDVFANPDQSFILDALENYAWRMGIYKESPFLTYLQLEKAYAILSRGNTTKKWLRWGETYISGVLSSCKDVETGTFSAFVNSKSTITGEACTRGELSSEAFFLMLAGSDTSATTASAVLFYLANHPDIYARLAMEIRTMYSSLAEIQSSGSRSTYLNACIMETLRLSPATISAPWRDVQRGGALIDEELIPEGYEVGTCIYAIHHDKSSFPHPHTFIPSRWLPEDPLHDILFTLPSTDPLSKTNLLSPTTPETQQLAMSPFGIGLRRCPGRSMALRNLHLLIARIIWQYDFRAAEGALGRVGRGEEAKGWKNWGRHREREFQLKATITSMSVGPWLVFRKRKNEVSE